MSIPNVKRNAIEGILLAAKAIVHMGSADQAPVESVGPTVIAALDASVEMPFSLRADAGSAMPAHVEERPQLVLAVAGNDHTLPGYLAQKVIAGILDLARATGADPGLAIETF